MKLTATPSLPSIRLGESCVSPMIAIFHGAVSLSLIHICAVLIVPSLLNSSGNLLRVGLDDLLSVAGTGKGICSFGVGEASADASVADILDQVRHSPLFLEKRLGEVDDVLVLVRGGASLTLQRLEALVDGVAEILGKGVRLHIGASVEQQTEDRLSLTVLGAVPVVETSVSPSVVLQREVASQTAVSYTHLRGFRMPSAITSVMKWSTCSRGSSILPRNSVNMNRPFRRKNGKATAG